MDDSNPNPRKRPRPVVSCLRCRDKKLKCDRTAPCENCIKASTAHSCTYKRSGHVSSNEVTPVPGVATANSLEDLQIRMARVEEMLSVQSGTLTQAVEKTKQHSLGTVVVKGDRSVYHGQNDRVTLLNQFLDVKTFINTDMLQNESVQASAKQVQFLQTKSATKIASPDSVVEPEFSLALLKLREFLPPKPYCDRLVSIYCNNFERTMRVLHVPTFMRQYEQLWKHNISEPCDPPSIIPQLTIVLTMAYHMEDAGDFIKDQNHRSYLKTTANDLVQAWLDELSRKQRTELATLQCEVLLLLSRSLRGMHPERLWSSAGALVRSAMVMGLHLDPSAITGFAPFQAEMRRRLWATILEIDLQASMATGMPTVFPTIDLFPLEPSNLNDLDFDETMATLPKSHPLATYTDNIYQVLLASSLPQRLAALSVIQGSTPDLKKAIYHGTKVEECINCIPRIVSLHNNDAAPLDGGSLLHRVLLDLYLRRPILCLYKPLLLASPQDTPGYADIHRQCLETSRAILSYQDLYTLPALRTVTNSPMAHQNFFYRCCKMDVLWAALTCCQRIKALRSRATNLLDGEQHTVDTTSLINTVGFTIDCLIDRIGQKGSDLKDLVFLALALQAVQLPATDPHNKRSTAERSRALQETVTKTLNSCRERMLQPIFANEHPQIHPPSKHLHTPSVPMLTAPMNTITPPISNPRLTPVPMPDVSSFPMHLSAQGEQWFGELPELATEFTNFQAEMYNPDDVMNFGIQQNWNWDNMWQ
ncbi:hypothetical protein CC86DRAFT_426013 [Ophiobolus disseminans]|uniref:Zn(2)-C6 fungal-type domain-containing protein n=1 Tax=Ophiobolus disseminans TaxID=1469910 RepID=A0A6A6ZLV3_9PLEO|nr:hypothetical protein CC86DRAFT_426013 [Ophiobolus disseminans]